MRSQTTTVTLIPVLPNVRYLMTRVTVGDDGILNLPDDVMEDLGWKEGDLLIWIDNEDGSFSLKKYEKTND